MNVCVSHNMYVETLCPSVILFEMGATKCPGLRDFFGIIRPQALQLVSEQNLKSHIAMFWKLFIC